MKKAIFEIEEGLPIKLSFIEGKVTSKGYIHPGDVDKVWELIKNTIIKNRYYWDIKNNNKSVIKWHLNKPGVIADDMEHNSIIVKIPKRTYYIPYVGQNNNTVFKIELPVIIAIKKENKHRLYWTDSEYEDVNEITEIYQLNMPHNYSSGEVCIGDFKEELDFNNPLKYFIDLISYPVSHSNEVNMLREYETNGYKKNYSKNTNISNIIRGNV